MKNTLNLLVCLMLAAAVGCGNTSPTGGGPITSSTGTSHKDTFTIKGPSSTLTLKQGDRESTKLTLDRGTEFKKSVKLEAQAPTGIKVSFEPANVKASDPAEAGMTVEADKSAALGDQIIHVTANPEAGSSTALDVKIKIEEKK